jgi:hypothetical protein
MPALSPRWRRHSTDRRPRDEEYNPHTNVSPEKL